MSRLAVQYRLRRRGDRVARALKLDDPDEIEDALQEIQVEIWRYLYHLRSRRVERLARQQVRTRSRTGQSLAGAIRGRRVGSRNLAVLQLHLSLATIWARHTGRQASRRYDSMKAHAEYGPYQDFVQSIFAILPPSLRPTRKGAVPLSVRTGIEEAKLARTSRAEYRRRGVIEEPD